MTTEIAEGLRYLLGHRVLRTLAVMVGVMNLAAAAAGAIFVLYAVAPGPMGLSEPEFGVLMTTFALGSVAGSIFAGRVERLVGRVRLLFVAVLVTAVSIAVPAFTANALLIGASFVVSGVFIVIWNVITVSLRQRIIPDRLLGRVNSGYRLLAWGTQPVGALLGGVIAELLGLPAVFLFGGVLVLLLVLARAVLTEEALATAEREAEGRPVPDTAAATS